MTNDSCPIILYAYYFDFIYFLWFLLIFLQLDRLVDIIVASPGRLLKHKYQSNVFLSHVNHIIIDEVDTMLTEGFGSDIRAILRSVISRPSASSKSCSSATTNSSYDDDVDEEDDDDDAYNLDDGDNKISSNSSSSSSSSSSSNRVRTAKQSLKLQHHQQQLISTQPVQVVMATATLTKAVRTLIDDVQNGGFNIEFNDPDNLTPRKSRSEDPRVKINIVEVDGVHR